MPPACTKTICSLQIYTISFDLLAPNDRACTASQNTQERYATPTHPVYQRWSRGHKARGQSQGHKKNPRPRTVLPRTDLLETKATGASVLQRKGLQKIFRAISKKGLQKFSARFLAFSYIILKTNTSLLL